MDDLTIFATAGMFGASEHDDMLDTALRKIATTICDDKGEWAEKYGTDFENDVFMMHRFCWCDQDGCAWCGSVEEPNGAPNFHYKPTGFKVWWYKYIGRSVETEGDADIPQMIVTCLESLSGPDAQS